MLTAHEAFHLLKVSFAVPRLQYLLRTAPVFSSTHCLALAEAVRDTLSGVLNLRWSEDSWAQASLPVRWGGLGVRDVVPLAPSCFLASVHASALLVRSILPEPLAERRDTWLDEAVEAWTRLEGPWVMYPAGSGPGMIQSACGSDRPSPPSGLCGSRFGSLVARPS